MDVIVVRGTPDEIRQLFPDVGRLLDDRAALTVAREPASYQQEARTDPVAERLREYIAKRAMPGLLALVDEFATYLAECGAVLDIGQSARTPDKLGRYFYAHGPGPRRFGAALYVHPGTGRIDFHLQPGDVTDGERAAGAFDRPVADGHPYAVTLMLDLPGKVAAAQQLAIRALRSVSDLPIDDAPTDTGEAGVSNIEGADHEDSTDAEQDQR